MAGSSVSGLARRATLLLRQLQTRLVLAESCTCGLIAAAIGETPGISQWLCGSAVVYQEATKTAWLGVPEELIRRRGVVSREVARAMAVGALNSTPHADVAASVTGHLGPNAPKRLDGVVYAAVAFRGPPGGEADVVVSRRQFEAFDGLSPRSLRLKRRRLAACWVLELLSEALISRIGTK